MTRSRLLPGLALGAMLLFQPSASAQQAGSIRGVVYDQDFSTPLAEAQVVNVETGQAVLTTEQGNFVLGQVPPGKYTLVFSKEGYVRQVRPDVLVTAGQLTDLDVWLSGEFTELEEFVVQDVLQLGAGSEGAMLQLRLESPSLMDSIGADLMSKAGAGDAASALRLVAGATVQDGKSAVIRGLPDRYVSSQMNSVRLPSADDDKRAVELDQFPSEVIESIQISKTFTPDQQGDASGGAVNVRLKGIPDRPIVQFKSQAGYNSQVTGRDDFLTYDGGGVDFLGLDADRDIQYQNLGDNWDGAVGVSRDDAPIDYELALDVGGKTELGDGIAIGGFANLYYERDSSFYDDGQDDSLWVVTAGDRLSPEYTQGAPDGSGGGDYRTSMFDVTQGTEAEQWGVLSTLGVESSNHALDLTFLYTHLVEDTATLAEDTRGKEFFFPGYDPGDPAHPGNQELYAAPYIRTETLEYSERTTGTLQLGGRHTLPPQGFELGGAITFQRPELDWTVAKSSADLDQPDKRQFAAIWQPFLGGFWQSYKPSATFLLGNLQRTWKKIEEDSDQASVDLELPFEQWAGEPGYLKFGLFADRVDRVFDQDSFSNFNEISPGFEGGFDEYWSAAFPFEDHPVTASLTDVDYDGDQDITAWYGMLDLPLFRPLNVIGGVRFESTQIDIVNEAEEDATWFEPGASSPVELEPGEADVSFEQDDVLPALGLVYQPHEQVTLRGSFSQTVARQTFKELTPILQQEYLGGPVFIGNPDLQMSSLQNYDLRLDYAPYEGGLLSASWFYKDLDDPIEYVQRVATFTFTTPRNYPEGELSGFEVEVRQSLQRFSEQLEGLSIGANATFIDSEVTLPADEVLILAAHDVDMTTRDATNAPEYLYNLYLTYDFDSETQVGIFYTVQGDTLVAGAGALGGTNYFVPNVYATEFNTLNLSLSRRIGKHFRLQLQAKNLTDPDIETVYRADGLDDVTKTSYSTGREYSLALSVNL